MIADVYSIYYFPLPSFFTQISPIIYPQTGHAIVFEKGNAFSDAVPTKKSKANRLSGFYGSSPLLLTRYGTAKYKAMLSHPLAGGPVLCQRKLTETDFRIRVKG